MATRAATRIRGTDERAIRHGLAQQIVGNQNGLHDLT